MKHLLTIFVLSCALSFAGCDSDDTSDPVAPAADTTTPADDTATPADDTAAPADDTAVAPSDAGTGTVHEVTTTLASMAFDPVDLTIAVGDTVKFVMVSNHNAIEVSKETYDAKGTEPLDGGFEVDFGETKEVTFTEAGVHYYVCQPHVMIDMIGTITVE